MSLLLKDPGAALDYAIDWGAEYLVGDALVESAWSVVPTEPGGVLVLEASADERQATVKVSGGLAGKLYRLVNHVVTAGGREDSRSIMLRVEQR